jgi:hypothetical protein
MAAFAARWPAFDLGVMEVTCLLAEGGRGFVALTPRAASAELVALEAAVVPHFEPFRAPLTEAERARRRPEQLTEAQRANLDRFGYPHVGAEFRFHMTLTGLIDDPAPVADHLAERLANACGPVRLRVEDLVLFGQAAESGRFRILHRFPLTG